MKNSLLSCLIFFFSINYAFAQDTGWKWRFDTNVHDKMPPGSEKRLRDGIYAKHSDEQVFVLDFNGNLYALNKSDGSEKWRYKVDNYQPLNLNQTHLIVNQRHPEKIKILGRENVTGEPADIISLNPLTGKPVWAVNDSFALSSSFDITDDFLIRTRQIEDLKAFDLRTGKLKWVSDDCEFSINKIIDAGVIFNEAVSGICAVDLRTGKTLWKMNSKESLDYLVASNKNLLVLRAEYSTVAADGLSRSFLYSVDKRTGKRVWQSDRSEKIFFHDAAQFVVAPDGAALFVTFLNSPEIIAFGMSDGKIRWRLFGNVKNPDGGLSESFEEPVFFGDTIYFGSRYGILYAANRTTGKLLWSRKIGEDYLTSPLIVGRFGYAASRNILYKIDLASGEIIWKFSAYGLISNLVYEKGVLYFDSRDGSYNALDLAEVERLAALKIPLGTPNPKKDALKRQFFTLGVKPPES